MIEQIQDTKEQIQDIQEQSFFSKIKKYFFFLLLSDETKEEIAQQVIQDSYFWKLYWLQLVLSCVIATLGLLTNSIPVVIWAMLIAPILQPIKVFSFAIATGNRHFYKRGLSVLFFSIIVTIATASLITLLVPFATITTEITSRTSPTLVDLFIALAGGIIAFLSLGFKRLSESLAWVAMAAALIPPLCATGVGVAFLNLSIANWSFLLFLANIFAIIFVGIIILLMFWFVPGNKKWEKRTYTNIFLAFLTIIIISVPLVSSMKTIAKNMNTNHIIKTTISDYISTINPNITLEKFDYQNIDGIDKLFINSQISAPDSIKITDQHKNEISKILAANLKKSIDFNLQIIDISSVVIDIPKEPTKEDVFGEKLQKILTTENNGIIIINKNITYQNKFFVFLTLFSSRPIDKEQLEKEIEQLAKENLWKETMLLIERQEMPKIQNISHEYLEQQLYIKKTFSNILSGTKLDNINFEVTTDDIYSWWFVFITLDFFSSYSPEIQKQLLEQFKQYMIDFFKKNVVIKTTVYPFQEETL